MTIRFGLAGLQHPHLEYLLEEIAGRPDDVRSWRWLTTIPRFANRSPAGSA